MPRLTSDVQAFEAHATDADLDDLRARLAAARLPEAETVHRAAPGPRRWDQGVPLADLVDVVDYWRTGYDWRSFEERLDRIGQFRTTIDGLGIHFLHRRSARADATPLIVTHGWPGSIAEFIDVVDELADPEDADAPAFHVVVPSLPGFGYSDKPATTGWGTEKIAAAWVELMGQARLRQVRSPRRRLGRQHHHGPRRQVPGARSRHPHDVRGGTTRVDDGRADGGRAQVDRGDPRTSGATARRTRSSRRPDRRPSATRSSTHRSGCSPGSWTSSPSGRTPRTARSRRSPGTGFSTTSPCTG